MASKPSNDPSKGDLAKAPPPTDRQQMLEAVGASQRIAKAQEYAQGLRDKAAKARDPKERERYIREAYAKEVEANGERSKLARRMQSGTWQGMFGGGGIGLGTGLGLGAVVGTLVGTIVSVPTTALGTLIGAGVGAIHGPWITIAGQKKKWTEASPEEVVDYYQAQQQQQAAPAIEEASGQTPVRRKPRKLEVRSKATSATVESTPIAEDMSASQELQKRRPRKLDSRSQSQTGKENISDPQLAKEAEDSGYAEDG